MKDEEYKALKEKLRKEEERRTKLISFELQIDDFKKIRNMAFKECGGLAYIKSMKLTITQCVDDTGDGHGGNHDEYFEFNFERKDKAKVKEMINKYIADLEEELIRLKEED